MSSENEIKLKQVLKDNLNLGDREDIALDEDLHVLGLNSISFVKVVVGLEMAFDTEFDDDSLVPEKFRTVGDFLKYIEESL